MRRAFCWLRVSRIAWDNEEDDSIGSEDAGVDVGGGMVACPLGVTESPLSGWFSGRLSLEIMAEEMAAEMFSIEG